MNRFGLLAAVWCCYILIIVAAVNIHVGYGDAFAFMQDPLDAEQRAYFTAGRLLVFLNLWAAVFYINAGLARGGVLRGSGIVIPVVTSTVFAALIYLCTPYVYTYGGMYVAGRTGWFF